MVRMLGLALGRADSPEICRARQSKLYKCGIIGQLFMGSEGRGKSLDWHPLPTAPANFALMRVLFLAISPAISRHPFKALNLFAFSCICKNLRFGNDTKMHIVVAEGPPELQHFVGAPKTVHKNIGKCEFPLRQRLRGPPTLGASRGRGVGPPSTPSPG